MGWAGDNGDPDNFLTPQFSCAAVQSGTNFARYCNPYLDNVISDGKTTSEQGVRTKLYEQAQAPIQHHALWLPPAHPTAFAQTGTPSWQARGCQHGENWGAPVP